MRIGIDIDNTIICYDGVFGTVARLLGHDIDAGLSKAETKGWFHSREMYDEFTKLQGLIYGTYMGHAGEPGSRATRKGIEESPGSTKQGWRVTPARRVPQGAKPRESATESIPPMAPKAHRQG